MNWKLLTVVACVCAGPLAGRGRASDPLTLGDGRQPQVAVTASGVFVAFAKDGAVYVARSADRGGSFGPPVEVASPKNMPVGMRRGPRIAATDDAIVITAVSGERGAGKDGDVVGWRSSDGGATWAPLSAPLNRAPGAAREGLHAMAAGPDGQMFCAWLDLRNAGTNGSGGTEVWGARSADHGMTWSRDFLIYRSPEKSVCQCCHPSVAYAADGTTVAVMFRNELSGNRDMYVVHSDDGGKTFGEARKLGTGSWQLAACPMDGGMLAFATPASAGKRSPKLTTTWRRGDEIFIASPGRPERRVGSGLQPWTATSASGSCAVWVTARPGDLMLYNGDDQPRKIATGASDPTIASAPDGSLVVATWEQGGEVRAMTVDAGH